MSRVTSCYPRCKQPSQLHLVSAGETQALLCRRCWSLRALMGLRGRPAPGTHTGLSPGVPARSWCVETRAGPGVALAAKLPVTPAVAWPGKDSGKWWQFLPPIMGSFMTVYPPSGLCEGALWVPCGGCCPLCTPTEGRHKGMFMCP